MGAGCDSWPGGGGGIRGYMDVKWFLRPHGRWVADGAGELPLETGCRAAVWLLKCSKAVYSCFQVLSSTHRWIWFAFLYGIARRMRNQAPQTPKSSSSFARWRCLPRSYRRFPVEGVTYVTLARTGRLTARPSHRDGVHEGIEWLVECVKRNAVHRPPKDSDFS